MDHLVFVIYKLIDAILDRKLSDLILKQLYNVLYTINYRKHAKKFDAILEVLLLSNISSIDKDFKDINEIFLDLRKLGIKNLIDFIILESLLILKGYFVVSSRFREATMKVNKVKKLNLIEKNYLRIEQLDILKFSNQSSISFPKQNRFGLFFNNSKKFNDLVMNKSIAIIGPGYISKESLNEIKQFDTLVTLNNINFCNDFSKSIKNSPDICYLNSFTLNEFLSRDSQTLIESNSYKVIKSIPQNSLKLLNYTNFRLVKSLYFFINGSPNLGIIAAWDLLHFNPSRLKIFGIDFYLSKKKYRNEDYISNRFEINSRTFSIHNPISNIRLIKYLHKLGKIELESINEPLLLLDDESIMKNLSSKFL